MNSDSHGYTFEVSLRIWHPEIGPEEVSDGLGLSPTTSWKSGTRVNDRLRESTYWTTRLPHLEEVTLARFLVSVVDELIAHASFLERLVGTGGRCELFVGLFLQKNTGEVLPSEVLRGLGVANVDLALDIYCPQ